MKAWIPHVMWSLMSANRCANLTIFKNNLKIFTYDWFGKLAHMYNYYNYIIIIHTYKYMYKIAQNIVQKIRSESFWHGDMILSGIN